MAINSDFLCFLSQYIILSYSYNMKKILSICISCLLISSCSFFDSKEALKRDESRLSDLRNLQSIVERYYYDHDEFYPNSLWDLENIPSDPKTGEIMSGCTFGYTYEVWDYPDLKNQTYTLKSCLETTTYKQKMGETDGGSDDNKYEIIQ